MAILDELDGHLGLGPHCGACGSLMKVSKRFVVHCFDVVAQRCKLDDYLDHLWIATAWRTPWRQAPNLRLEEPAITLDLARADDLGIPRMRVLTPEILRMVHGYSATSLFWRYSGALDLVRRLSTSSLDELLSVPLCTVSAWKRGPPVLSKTVRQLPVFRLTIDSYGIREIERLPERPRFQRWRTDSLAFVILEQSYLQGVTARFKIWDTPIPPVIEQCPFYPANITSSTHFRTIELCKTTGITLFFCLGDVYAIHAHTKAAPCPEATYRCLSRRRQRSITWAYMPIPENDSIVAFGTQIALFSSDFEGAPAYFPVSSQATSDETEVRAVLARFEEWPLENASLKRITENSRTTF
ncbi:hypothetical protein BGZ61DRAFT_524174 [Ilyonectria robusta]|uniref:uncharacterized protein n=1 Tax=Ilyonectria robusta TaxID=1079257 RepID=UPI001E8E066C|nr:uncharacterized protein BGZ61DRAFT_524174 [Ilyonectria robusta]KAH8654723.1 hypothetical protein BGZ61DRAFT_524174 [Ilyonectria robusta]